MAEYILFMHDDATAEEPSAWKAYLQGLDWKGVFEGGSEIGICVRKGGGRPTLRSTWPAISGPRSRQPNRCSRRQAALRKPAGRWR